MTISSAVKETPARKGVTAKPWKESLRKACLDRARRRRSPSIHSLRDDPVPARLLIEDEMMQQGISLRSPCVEEQCGTPQLRTTPNNSLLVNDDELHDEPMDASDLLSRLSSSAPDSNHFISEEELFDLLAEVEAEIERTDSLQVDEMLELALGDEQDLEDRIADFEHWEEGQPVQGVLCPVCHEANLLKSQSRLVCPNHMDQSCPFDIANPLDLSLDDLRERLRVAYDQHASYCHGDLAFETTQNSMMNEGANLVAVCSMCESKMHLA